MSAKAVTPNTRSAFWRPPKSTHECEGVNNLLRGADERFPRPTCAPKNANGSHAEISSTRALKAAKVILSESEIGPDNPLGGGTSKQQSPRLQDGHFVGALARKLIITPRRAHRNSSQNCGILRRLAATVNPIWGVNSCALHSTISRTEATRPSLGRCSTLDQGGRKSRPRRLSWRADS